MFKYCNYSTSNSLEKYDKYRPSLESLGIKRTSEPEPEPVPHPIVNADLEEDISDSEIDSYILTESEVAIKTDYWMKANGEAMKEIEEKKRERELNGGVKKKKPRSNRKTDTTSTSVASAVEKVIAEKKLSNKVNYEMLKDLETMATGIKRDIRESTPAPVTPISIKVDSSDVTPDTLSKSEKIARGKNIRSQASESTIQKLRSIFDLTEECSETSKNSSPKVNLKVESASPSTSEVSSIEHKPFVPPARSRYAKVKPIIGAKKLAAVSSTVAHLDFILKFQLNEVKNVHTVPEPSAPAEPIVSEAPLQVKTSSSDPIVTSTEVLTNF